MKFLTRKLHLGAMIKKHSNKHKTAAGPADLAEIESFFEFCKERSPEEENSREHVNIGDHEEQRDADDEARGKCSFQSASETTDKKRRSRRSTEEKLRSKRESSKKSARTKQDKRSDGRKRRPSLDRTERLSRRRKKSVPQRKRRSEHRSSESLREKRHIRAQEDLQAHDVRAQEAGHVTDQVDTSQADIRRWTKIHHLVSEDGEKISEAEESHDYSRRKDRLDRRQMNMNRSDTSESSLTVEDPELDGCVANYDTLSFLFFDWGTVVGGSTIAGSLKPEKVMDWDHTYDSKRVIKKTDIGTAAQASAPNVQALDLKNKMKCGDVTDIVGSGSHSSVETENPIELRKYQNKSGNRRRPERSRGQNYSRSRKENDKFNWGKFFSVF